jgi:hypothetical protein
MKIFSVVHSLIFFILGQSATSGPLKKMGDIFRRHPEYFIPDQETGFQKTASGCCAYSDVHQICLISLVEILHFLINFLFSW